MKPRIRRQAIGWAVEQGTLLIDVVPDFAGACALARRWVGESLVIV